MARQIDPERLARFNERQLGIIYAANDWGYLDSGLCREEPLYQGRHVLDIGMGGGPYSIAFIVGGAASYAGVDPMVGTANVRDPRSFVDSSIPDYHAFPYTVEDIMEAFPNVKLFPGYVEDAVENLKQIAPDFITLSAVTEHLETPDKVIRAAHKVARPDAALWLSHANYYSWSGHHLDPRDIESWDHRDPAHNKNADWEHLRSDHYAYSLQSLNRVRLNDFRLLIDKYFEIVQWREYIECADRLTTEIRRRWKKYTLSELLARWVYVYAKRRERPLLTDLSGLNFHHPDRNYRADADFSNESDRHIRESNSVFFGRTRQIGGHTYNDGSSAKLMGGMVVGDKLTLQKHANKVTVTVENIVGTGDSTGVRFIEEVSDQIYDDNAMEWTIINVERASLPASSGRSEVYDGSVLGDQMPLDTETLFEPEAAGAGCPTTNEDPLVERVAQALEAFEAAWLLNTGSANPSRRAYQMAKARAALAAAGML